MSSQTETQSRWPFFSALRSGFAQFRADWKRSRGPLKRAYDAAKYNRLTADWPFLPITANRELRQSLRTLRNRSRERSQNDDYIKKFLSMVPSNVAGPAGFTLLLTVDRKKEELSEQQKLVDEEIVKEVKRAFEEWSHKENASASGKLSWVDQQRLFIRTIARDGEVLVRKIVASNPFGFALKFVDVSWLDEMYNQTLTNGNRVLMSVEVDQNDRPVAYWLTMPPSEYLFSARPPGAPHRQRVPAEEFIHAFLVLEDESQVRGVPWAHTALARLKILAGYEEAELVAARVGACKMAWIIQPRDKDEELPEPEVDEDGNPKPIDIPEEMQPGINAILPVGYDVKDVDPKHPNANYAAFSKTVLRGLASGLDVSYVSLANDLEGVNYSSIRAGLLEERDVWRALQIFEAEHFNRVVFRDWLKMAVLSGRVSITAADFERLRATWRPRGWAWTDPMKEVQATILAIKNLIGSRTDDAAARGEDWNETLAELEAEAKAIEAAGLKVEEATPKPTVNADSETPDKESKDNAEQDDEEARVLPMFERHLA